MIKFFKFWQKGHFVPKNGGSTKTKYKPINLYIGINVLVYG